MDENYLVFDLETQRDAQSVGGWGNIADMKMSVGVIWDSRSDKFFVYEEVDVEKMIAHLMDGTRVIGFNHIGFDYQVVSGYRPPGDVRVELLKKLQEGNNLDLLLDLKERLGHRIKLDSVAKPTLESTKSADGLQALEWFKQYEKSGDRQFLDRIISYCQQDVAVTRDVFLYGLEKKHIFYEGRQGLLRAEVNWEVSAQLIKKEPRSEQLTLF